MLFCLSFPPFSLAGNYLPGTGLQVHDEYFPQKKKTCMRFLLEDHIYHTQKFRIVDVKDRNNNIHYHNTGLTFYFQKQYKAFILESSIVVEVPTQVIAMKIK